ncbi:pirin family protein [Haloactinomyces albus]|uniref:Redox-sensitive bicupin YhaK (Pirin superfamily) n=1 Tax=Haloactinomyces albus TaxID=1352928 RepID=A0AAE3ZEX7_9ACTN|nr:pirin family protein [Haloactinomyces albus]MDR7303693.1 redox-sensitive bicupin YhaK (pirin superfamily) [Haloactinomyces albus]
MSNVEDYPAEQTVCSAGVAVATEPDIELLYPREVPLGGPRAMRVRRALPNRDRRMVGAWCFADSYGPSDITGQAGMQVPPHPHTGLQTVTWLAEGEVWHQDSVGSRRLVRPGELPLMTAGHGIAHSEQSPPDHSASLYGAQLWVALPEESRQVAPAFEFHSALPRHESRQGSITVLAGEVDGAISPATTYSPLVGAGLAVPAGGQPTVPLEPEFEHAILALSPGLSAENVSIPVGAMLYLGRGRDEVRLSAEVAGQALVLGGQPFAEDLVMWWNFIGRSHDDIVAARSAWEREHDTDTPHRRFGPVDGYDGPALAAPTLPNARLKARGRYHPHH